MTQIDPISPDLSLLVLMSPFGPILGKCVFPCGVITVHNEHKRKYADTDDSTSESDSEHSAMTKNMPEFQELTETFTADGLEEEEARDKAYLTILPKLRKDLQSIYLNRLLWIAQMKKDPFHKQIMKTKDAFANDDNFDPEEALEAAVDKRKFLMKRLFGDTRSTNTL